MEETELKQKCLGLMENAEVVYLSTIDENGFPQIRAMGNFRNKNIFPDLAPIFEGHNEDLLIYLGTDPSSAKVKHIRANPKGAVYYRSVSESFGLMAAGFMEIVNDERLKRKMWQERWEKYYPDRQYTLLRLVPDFARGWYKKGTFEFRLK